MKEFSSSAAGVCPSAEWKALTSRRRLQLHFAQQKYILCMFHSPMLNFTVRQRARRVFVLMFVPLFDLNNKEICIIFKEYYSSNQNFFFIVLFCNF